MTQECVDDICFDTLVTGGRMTKTSINAVFPDANNAHWEIFVLPGLQAKENNHQPPTPPNPIPNQPLLTVHPSS